MKQLYATLFILFISSQLIQATSISSFYQLKDNAYRRDIYPHDQSFALELLRNVDQIAPQSQITYLRAILKAFTNIAKGTHYITANSFNISLTQLSEILAPQMHILQQTHYIKHHIDQHVDMLTRLQTINKNILLHGFNTNYEMFRSTPVEFIDNLALQLADIAHKELELQELRHTILTFLEIHLNKLIWAPEDQEETWNLVKTIAENLAIFVELDILDDVEYLNDVYYTLVHRYCHFLDLTHELLEYSLFSKIKQDILKQDSLIFALEEQDDCLEKRIDCVRTMVMHIEAKKQALEHGLI